MIEGPGAQPRVVLMGRLAVYGAGAARLHEEVIPVTAIWSEADRDRNCFATCWSHYATRSSTLTNTATPEIPPGRSAW